jgi:arylformamidase
MTKKFLDITLELGPSTVTFPGDPPVQIFHPCQLSKGDPCNLSVLTLSSHAGTHVDPPRHFYEHGLGVDQLPLEHFIGPARVLEIPDKQVITPEELLPFDIKKNEIILLKTRNSLLIKQPVFSRDFAYLSPEAGQYLAEIGILTLGFDYFSCEAYSSQEYEVHHALLGEGIVIIEGLVLTDVPPGSYTLVALPLKIKEGNGSPVRAILIAD